MFQIRKLFNDYAGGQFIIIIHYKNLVFTTPIMSQIELMGAKGGWELSSQRLVTIMIKSGSNNTGDGSETYD